MRMAGSGTVALALALLFALSACGNGVSREDYDQLSSEMVAAQQELNDLQANVQAAQAEVSQLREKEPPQAEELRQAAETLLSSYIAAAQTQDGATLHRLLVTDIRERCTVEQIQGSLVGDIDSDPGDLEVRTVYLDVADPNKALVQVAVGEAPEEGLGGLASALLVVFPFPLEQEEGEWRLNFPSLFLESGDGCPFAAEFETEEQDRSVPQPREVRVLEAESPLLASPPGAISLESRYSAGGGEVNDSLLLETDLTLTELLEYYEEQVLEPDSEAQHPTVTEDLAALTWTFHDEGGTLWFGVLMVTPRADGVQWVRLWMWMAAPVGVTLSARIEEAAVPAATPAVIEEVAVPAATPAPP